jgi:hypothetical protein
MIGLMMMTRRRRKEEEVRILEGWWDCLQSY